MYVYWIKAEHHTDPNTEGYVGVASNPLARYNHHKKANVNPKLRSSLEKYNTHLVILHEGNRHWCYSKENEYRPIENVGWNIRPGGQYHVHTDNIKQKISETHKKLGTNPYSSEKTHSPEAIAKRKAKMVGRKWYYNPEDPTNRTLATKCPTGWLEGKIPTKPLKERGKDYVCNVCNWKLTDPQGNDHMVFNLKDWCRDKGLPYLGPHRGKMWRGWRIEKL